MPDRRGGGLRHLGYAVAAGVVGTAVAIVASWEFTGVAGTIVWFVVGGVVAFGVGSFAEPVMTALRRDSSR